MQRDVLDLYLGPITEWCFHDEGKPLILLGGWRVGKTWVVKQFADIGPFSDIYYIDFLKNKDPENLFTPDMDVNKLAGSLSKCWKKGPCPAGRPGFYVLFIFDNVQACPNALLCLNSFYKEKACRVIAIGSPMKIPCEIKNCAKILRLYPFSFSEFLQEFDKELSKQFKYFADEDEGFRDQFLNAFHYYLSIGGMPECINKWKETGSLEKVRIVQNDLLQLYKQELLTDNLSGKSTLALGRKSVSILDSIPDQLSKPNQKFMADHVPVYAGQKTVGKHSVLKKALNYLCENGILLPILPENADSNELIPFLFDTGLLGALAGIDIGDIASGRDFPFKEILKENYLVQELHNNQSYRLFYRCDKHERHCRKDYIRSSKEGSESYRYVITESKISSKRIRRSNEKWIIFTENSYLKEDYCCYIPIYMTSRFKEIMR